MKRAIVLFTALALMVPIMALAVQPAPKGPTPAEQIESLSRSVLDFKFRLGQEMQVNAQIQAKIMQLEKQLAKAKQDLVNCRAEVKPENLPDETK